MLTNPRTACMPTRARDGNHESSKRLLCTALQCSLPSDAVGVNDTGRQTQGGSQERQVLTSEVFAILLRSAHHYASQVSSCRRVSGLPSTVP